MNFIYYEELQDTITQYYKRTGKMLSFSDALNRMFHNNISHSGPIPYVDFSTCNLLDIDQLNACISRIPIPYSTSTLELESHRSLQKSLIVFKYPEFSRAGIHIQDGIELNYVYSGTCTMYFEGDTYTLTPNQVYIIPPHTHHDVYDTENAVVFSFLIHQNIFNETFFQILKTDSPLSTFYSISLYNKPITFLRFQISESQKFLQTFLAMYSEFSSAKSYNYDICINYIRILFLYLLRQPQWNFEQPSDQMYENVVSNMPLILQYIKNNYQTVSLNFLADFFHYDRSYLGKLIKQYTNASFSELVTNYRMAHALSLLLNTSESIEHIAETTGYNSADHFSRMFKKKYGTSPSNYRKHPFSLNGRTKKSPNVGFQSVNYMDSPK